MKSVTPFGVLTRYPDESKAFYRDVIGIERILTIPLPERAEMTGCLLRLESPRLELFASEVRLLDRATNDRVQCRYQVVYYPVEMTEAAMRLWEHGVSYETDQGGHLHFADMNGVDWELRSPPDSRSLTSRSD